MCNCGTVPTVKQLLEEKIVSQLLSKLPSSMKKKHGHKESPEEADLVLSVLASLINYFITRKRTVVIHGIAISKDLIDMFHKLWDKHLLQRCPLFVCHTSFARCWDLNLSSWHSIRDGSRAAATSKMEHFVITVNSWKPLTIITKRSILDVAAALDPPLSIWKISNSHSG